ncbi:glycerate kinase [Actinomycetospora lutea]|uniref:glycerate kinase n=1 Tax=Actinomycetospora lutea TaxID=663604 RepID=UPI002366B479|nr:glycerate kinase [Actinomycetospora lutea]MDD7938083.1 glycerate kinase [Actinomycetospora lutea]
MSVLIALGSFKGSVRSTTACSIVYRSLLRRTKSSEVAVLPLADGGEGTLEVFEHYFGGSMAVHVAHDCMGRRRRCRVWTNASGFALIESAEVVGHSLVGRADRDPWAASSRGVAELINELVADGFRVIAVSMGDSAVMDFGVGMLAELGVRFYRNHVRIDHPRLAHLATISGFDARVLSELWPGVTIFGLVDTYDFVCGEDGQGEQYGHQKGLVPSDSEFLEACYSNFTSLIEEELGVAVGRLPFGGGSGGLGGALAAFLGADLVHTPEYLDNYLGISRRIAEYSHVVTGEGQLDRQTKWGKVPYYVASRVSSDARFTALVGSSTIEGSADLLRVAPQAQIVELHVPEPYTGTRNALSRVASGLTNG